LRQISAQVAAAEAFLFRPQTAIRVRRSVNTDTPIPHEEPMGQNPPDGAIINYYLRADAGDVTVEILDSANGLVRRFSSSDKPEQIDENELAYPTYWFRPPQTLSNKAGMQRFVWDLRYSPPEGFPRSYPISAIYRDTPSQPLGPFVLPGQYTIRLTVGGRSYAEPLAIKMDPRVTTQQEGLKQQYDLSMQCYEGMKQIRNAIEEARKLGDQLRSLSAQAGQTAPSAAIKSLDQKIASIVGAAGGRFGGGSQEPSLNRARSQLLQLMTTIQGSDFAPTTAMIMAGEQSRKSAGEMLDRWRQLKDGELKALNELLRQAGLPRVSL
jgi:hypothetical protein